MKHLFVPYEIAVVLKEKGFNEPCLMFFSGNGALMDNDGKNGIGMEITSPFYNFDGFPQYDTKMICAPIFQQVIDWFREKHEIYFTNIQSDGLYSFQITWHDGNKLNEMPIKGGEYYEALTNAIISALKLI